MRGVMAALTPRAAELAATARAISARRSLTGSSVSQFREDNELFGELSQVRGLAAGAALVVQEGEIGDELRRVEWNRRAGVDLVVEGLAQGMLFEQGRHDGGRVGARCRAWRGRSAEGHSCPRLQALTSANSSGLRSATNQRCPAA